MVEQGSGMTPGALAGMLGISPTTLRTWHRRYDLGPSARTSGHHRRYTPEDVERLRRMVALTARGLAPAAAARVVLGEPAPAPAADPRPALGEAEARTARRGFLSAANRLDEPLMRDLAAKLVAEHGVVDAWQHVFMPILVELGGRAVALGRGVEVEHVTSAAILHVLRGVPLPAEEGRLAALLACAPDEQHTLPLEALGAALSECDSTWRNLGARLPAGALLAAVDKLRPATVVVWAHRADLARGVPLDGLVTRFDAVVAVAGAGWEEVDVPPAVERLTSLRHGVRIVLGATGRGG
ncbi:MerR family transcriptional regulator [Saccharothrix lopnurensis]|uniref:MerR family transcriptional regulator n=1 Tax=Saccharothrix lopnurensis TaxID=1670621 RepID=A0ABW1PCJ6_9PSEU